MNAPPPSGDPERRLRNLQAVLRHHAAGGPGDSGTGSRKKSELRPSWKRRLSALGPLGLALIFVLGKLKLIVPLLKLTKLGTLLTMVLSVGVYGQIWGLPFALGFVLLIFVHEMGHVVVLRHQGIPAGAPMFIPFVGAMIAMKGQPRNAYVEALVGIGGPILGSVGAAICLVVAWAADSQFWFALAWTGFMLNLFNLIPIVPLDGGRIVGVLSRWLWIAGYAIGVLVLIKTHSPILFLILLLGLFGLGRTFRAPHAEYYKVDAQKRVAIGSAYFGLIALLTLGMWLADKPLQGLTGG